MIATSAPSTFARSCETGTRPAYGFDHARREDLNSFNELVLAHQDAVYRQAYWILGDPDAAEDAAQEAFLRAYHKLQSYNGGPFRPWIMRITTNYCLDQLRSQKAHKTTPLSAVDEFDEEIESPSWVKDPGDSVEEILVRADERAMIQKGLNQLPADYRTAIILVDLQDMDYEEASSVMGIPLGTFKSRLFRARMHLQKHLTFN